MTIRARVRAEVPSNLKPGKISNMGSSPESMAHHRMGTMSGLCPMRARTMGPTTYAQGQLQGAGSDSQEETAGI